MNAPLAARLVVLDTRTGSLILDKLVFLGDDPAEAMRRHQAQYGEAHHKIFAIATDQEEAQLPAPQLAERLVAMLAETERGWWDRVKGRLAGLLGAAVLAAWLPGCAAAAASASGAVGPVVDTTIDGERSTTPLAELAARVQVPPDENIAVVPLGADAHTSHALVGVRDREPLHVHASHDLVVLVLHGRGEMYLAGERRPVTAGSLVYVPRNTVHAFVNGADAPSVAYTIFSPPYDGADNIPVRPRE